jgi:cyclopropane-fatty-acyl-phospholipid synthase
VPGAGIYDKIASVGMFEHVGLANLPEYFGTLNRLLRPRGLVLNHGITSGTVEESDVISGGGGFIERYVFPHGELPHLSRTARDMSAAGLEVIDVESLRRHYALTCREWASRLDARKTEALALAGERRSRIWRIYLAGCTFGFDQGWVNVHQMLACKSQAGEMGSQPLTRDYMYQGSRSSME